MLAPSDNLLAYPNISVDHSCGIFSLLPNIIRKFGWNPGNKFIKMTGGVLEKKGMKADITFWQV